MVSKPEEHNPVSNPMYYRIGGIDTLDFIIAKELGYLEGNIIKYLVRHRLKENSLQDLKKARYYLNRLIEGVQNETK